MKVFKVGDQFASGSLFTVGLHEYEIVSRTETEIVCNAKYYELDGVHKVTEKFPVEIDDNGNEIALLWEYLNHKGYAYAKNEKE